MISLPRILLWGALGLAAAIVTLPPFYISLLAFGGLFALAAMGLVVLLQSGQVSLGHAAFVGLGAYTSAILTRDFGWSGWLGIVFGVIAAAGAAMVIGAATLRLRGHYLPLATIAWGIALSVIFVAWISLTGGASGFDNIPPLSVLGHEIRDDRVSTAIIWLAVAMLLSSLAHFQNSRIGRAMKALRANETMAETFGVSPFMVKLKLFALSAGLAALSGALYAHYLRFISPSPFGLAASFKLLIMAVLGGSGHVGGAIIGALFLEGFEYLLQGMMPKIVGREGNYEAIVFGTILVLVLIKWPNGMLSLFPHIRVRPTEREATGQGSFALATRPRVECAGPLLDIAGLSKNFGGLQALDNFSLTVAPGEIVGLIGPNGAGKTTAFNIIAGLHARSGGTIRFGPHVLGPAITDRVSAGLARTFQHVQLISDASVLENVALGAYSRTTAGFGACLTGVDRAEERATRQAAMKALERVGLSAHAYDEAGALSMGQQRLVEVARALAADPVLLLLDEPAAGLVHHEKRELARLISDLRCEGMTILLIEHDMGLVMGLVDRVVVMNRGRVLANGQPHEVQADPLVIEAYLGG